MHLVEVLAAHRSALEHRVLRGEALLAVHHQRVGTCLFAVSPDRDRANVFGHLLCQEKVARLPAISRVHHVSDLSAISHEGSLQFGEADLSELDLSEQNADRIQHRGDLRYGQIASPMKVHGTDSGNRRDIHCGVTGQDDRNARIASDLPESTALGVHAGPRTFRGW